MREPADRPAPRAPLRLIVRMRETPMIRLIGPGGAGKSTIGALLAGRLDVPFVDLDRHFADRAGDISEYIGRHGYEAYARENVAAYCSLFRGETRPDVVALSSGFMTYSSDTHPEYARVRREIEECTHTLVLLPSLDRELCVAEIVRRQIARPFGRSPKREEAVRARFGIYQALPTRQVETMRLLQRSSTTSSRRYRLRSRAHCPPRVATFAFSSTRLMDRIYLSFGLHGGVDFQKDNQYGPPSPRLQAIRAAAVKARQVGSSSWKFNAEGEPLTAVRVPINKVARIRPRWTAWQRVVTRVLVQPGAYRALVPISNFVVRNDTGNPLTLRFAGPLTRTERIAAGAPTVLRVVPGSYQLQVTSTCGNKSEAVTVSEGDRHELRYCCETERVPAAPTPRGGSLIVQNTSGDTMSLTIGGRTYKAAPGATTIPLGVGQYTVTATSKCGTKTEHIAIQDGTKEHATGHLYNGSAAPDVTRRFLRSKQQYRSSADCHNRWPVVHGRTWDVDYSARGRKLHSNDLDAMRSRN